MKRKLGHALIVTAMAANVHAATISANGITVRTEAFVGGAVCSLTWRGKEFVDCVGNHADHGRQIQSAASFNGLGEAYNPTKGGASHLVDGFTPSASTSQLLSEIASGASLYNQTQMAYWSPVGGAKLSQHVHSMQITIGYAGIGNVVKYDSTFQLPPGQAFTSGTFEHVTGYMPAEFDHFNTVSYDVNTGVVKVAPLDVCVDAHVPGMCPNGYSPEQPKPIIFSTQGYRYAMGLLSVGCMNGGYARYLFKSERVTKWSNVCRVNNPSGTYSYTSFIVVGTRAEVVASMVRLMVMFPQFANP